MPKEAIELFVPGRLCLFGEHSDWAGGHRRQNSEIEKGYAIVAPTNQGNHAKARRIDKPVIRFKSSAFESSLEVQLVEEELLRIAEGGGEFSYVAGVAHEILVNFNGHGNGGIEINDHTHGIEIDNYKSDLPIKKGLSSSASICVLIAKAFKEIYDLPLSTRGLMNLAYNGETTTPSRCGRLDQACAYPHPVLMTFDADKVKVEEIKPGKPLYFVVVDLQSQKNTKSILAELNRGFPFPTTKKEKRKHKYLGKINKDIVLRAKSAITNTDASEVGGLMKEAQDKFDEYLAPSCPEELTAPKLHRLLSYASIQEHIYGGKGVGSQGDGCAQLIARNEKSLQKVIDMLNSDKKLNVHAIPLIINDS